MKQEISILMAKKKERNKSLPFIHAHWYGKENCNMQEIKKNSFTKKRSHSDKSFHLCHRFMFSIDIFRWNDMGMRVGASYNVLDGVRAHFSWLLNNFQEKKSMIDLNSGFKVKFGINSVLKLNLSKKSVLGGLDLS